MSIHCPFASSKASPPRFGLTLYAPRNVSKSFAPCTSCGGAATAASAVEGVVDAACAGDPDFDAEEDKYKGVDWRRLGKIKDRHTSIIELPVLLLGMPLPPTVLLTLMSAVARRQKA